MNSFKQMWLATFEATIAEGKSETVASMAADGAVTNAISDRCDELRERRRMRADTTAASLETMAPIFGRLEGMKR
jgi:hypothetical protein